MHDTRPASRDDVHVEVFLSLGTKRGRHGPEEELDPCDVRQYGRTETFSPRETDLSDRGRRDGSFIIKRESDRSL